MEGPSDRLLFRAFFAGRRVHLDLGGFRFGLDLAGLRRFGLGLRLQFGQEGVDPPFGHDGILLAGAPAHADGADRLAVDDDGDAAEEGGELAPAGGGGILEAEVEQDVGR